MDYLQVKSAYQLKVVPQTDELTFLTKLTGIAQLWRWDEGSQSARQMSFCLTEWSISGIRRAGRKPS